MAQIHNEIRKGSLSEALNRALGRTREGGIERLGETIEPVINPWGMPEWAYLRREFLAAFAPTDSAAVAAEFSYHALVNPAGSNLIVVVEAVAAFTLVGAGSIFLSVATEAAARATLATTEQSALSRDRRDIRLSVAKLLSGTDAGQVGAIYERNVSTAANTPGIFTCLPIVLAPGTALLCRGGTVFVAQSSNWVWRERAAYPGELI